MNRTRFVFPVLFALALAFVLASCGGTSQVAGTSGADQSDFRAVRYDDNGGQSSALNQTLDLQVQAGGSETVVTVAVDDSAPNMGVTMDLHYDQQRYSPASVQFSNLIDTPVEMAVTRIGGLVALGQVSTTGSAERSGQFATVTFRNMPFRQVSVAGDAHLKPINAQYNAGGVTIDGLEMGATAADGTTTYDIYAVFAAGDGNQDGQSNISDLTPMGAVFQASVTPANVLPARADYDGNGQVNISDLTPLGAHFQEQTTDIQILLGDDGAEPTTVVDTIAWSSAANPVSIAGTDTDTDHVYRCFMANSVTAAEFATANVDADNDVAFSARTLNSGTGNTGPAFPAITLTKTGVVTNPNFVAITGVDVQVDGAAVADNDTLTWIANGTESIDLTGMSGQYDDDGPSGPNTPFAFTSADAGGSVPQAEYDTQLQLIEDNLTFVQTSTAAHSSTPTVLSLTNIGTGWDATAFPDDEPGNTAEGSLSIDFTGGGSNVSAPTVDLTIDVDVDVNAGIFTSLTTVGGQDGGGNWLVDPIVNDTIHAAFNFGAGGTPSPIDDTTTQFQLFNVTAQTVAKTFTIVPGLPAASGEAQVKDLGGGNFAVDALVTPSYFTAGSLYAIRMSAPTGVDYSSINKPGEFFTTAPLPAPVDLGTIPSDGSLGPDENFITIIFPDPRIRRNPEVTFSPVDSSVTADFDGGFSDKLKDSGGREFGLSASSGDLYPQVNIQPGNDPSTISAVTPDNIAPIVIERNPDRIAVDIAALGNPASAATDEYAFKVFDRPVTPSDRTTRPTIGQGTFRINDLNIIPAMVGVDFGVNIYDTGGRGAAALGSEDWSNKTLVLSTLTAAEGDFGTPDVLWVEFNGGHVYDPQTLSNNVQAVVSNAVTGDMTRNIDLRISGVGALQLDYIGFVHLTALDEFGVAGNLVAGTNYDIKLSDPGNPVQFTIPTGQLVAVN